jgi:hypothetical protein
VEIWSYHVLISSLFIFFNSYRCWAGLSILWKILIIYHYHDLMVQVISDKWCARIPETLSLTRLRVLVPVIGLHPMSLVGPLLRLHHRLSHLWALSSFQPRRKSLCGCWHRTSCTEEIISCTTIRCWSPPILTSWQRTLWCSLRRITSFTSPSPRLGSYTIPSSRRLCTQPNSFVGPPVLGGLPTLPLFRMATCSTPSYGVQNQLH